MSFFTLFSPPVVLRRCSERAAGWVSGSQPRSTTIFCDTWNILTATDSLHMQSRSRKHSFLSAALCLGSSVRAVASSHIVRNLAMLAKMWWWCKKHRKPQQIITRRDRVGQSLPSNKQENVRVNLQEKVMWSDIPSYGHGNHQRCVLPLSSPSLHSWLQSASSAGAPTLQQCRTGFPGESQEWAGEFVGVWVLWLHMGALGCSIPMSRHINASLPLRVFRGECTRHSPCGPDSTE